LPSISYIGRYLDGDALVLLDGDIEGGSQGVSLAGKVRGTRLDSVDEKDSDALIVVLVILRD